MTITQSVLVSLLSAILLLSPGCMHAMPGMDHSMEHEAPSKAPYVKDSQRDSIIIRVSVPQLVAGTMSRVVLSVLSSTTSVPYHDVRILAHWKMIDAAGAEQSGGHADHGAPPAAPSNSGFSEGSSMLSSDPKDGSLTFAFTPPLGGRVQLHFALVSIDGSESGSDVTAEVVQTVQGETSSHSGTGAMGTTPLSLVGIAVMGTMMALMLMLRVF